MSHPRRRQALQALQQSLGTPTPQLAPDVWIKVAICLDKLRDVGSLAKTCRNACKACQDPSLLASWLMWYKGPTRSILITVEAQHLKQQCRTELAARLLLGGATPNAVGGTHELSALMHAAKLGDVGVAQALVLAGADIHAEHTFGASWTPLHFAAFGGNVAIIQMLLTAGAQGSVNLQAGWSQQLAPLHIAAMEKRPTAIAALLAAGANVDARTGTGASTPLMLACKTGCTEAIMTLLAAGASATSCDQLGSSVLSFACQGGSLEGVKALVAAGAKIDEVGMYENPLMCAARGGNVDVVAYMIAAGADPNARVYGNTALQYAAAQGRIAVVRQLLAAGVDVDVADSQRGRTALHEAAENGSAAVVSALLAAGANAKLKTYDKKTVLQVARAFKNREAMAVFKAAEATAAAKP